MKVNITQDDITEGELNQTSITHNTKVSRGIMQLLRNIYNGKKQ